MYDNEMEERTAAEELARKKGYAPDGKWLQQQYKLIEKKWLNILKKGPFRNKTLVHIKLRCSLLERCTAVAAGLLSLSQAVFIDHL